MTPVFCCGFECGQLGSAGQHWPAPSYASISTSTIRTGSRSLRINPVSQNTASSPFTFTAVTLDNSAVVTRFYIYFASLPTVDMQILQYSTAASVLIGGVFFKSSDSSIYAHTSTNQTGATGCPIVTGRWYLIDSYFDTSRLSRVRVDGVDFGDASSTATANVATLLLCRANSNFSADIFIDDFVMSVTSGDYPIGAGSVRHFIPTADGTHNVAGAADFRKTLTATDILNSTTDAYQLIDDVPLESGASVDWINMIAPPNATDYVECVFGPASGAAPAAPPRAVEVIAGIHQAGTGTGNMEIRMNDNGTTNAMYTATTVAGVTSVAYKRKHYSANIANGGPWTVASGAGNFNNLRMRFGSPAAVDANPDQYLDCIMIEAEFVDPVPNKIININQSVKRASYY